jgi:DNA-binding NarL/FixJ family response regulator
MLAAWRDRGGRTVSHPDPGVSDRAGGDGGPTTSVVVVAAIRLYREGLAEVLGRTGRLRVTGSAAGATQALGLLRHARPDVVLLDTSPPDAIDQARMLAAAAPATPIVAIGLAERENEVIAFAEAGACGYVTRDGSLADLVAAAESVAHGEAICSPRMAASLLRRIRLMAMERPAAAGEPRLTAREIQIMGLIDRGLSNKEIARELCITVATVKNHVHNILEKLGVSRRGEAAARLRGLGLTEPTPV